MSRAYPLLTFLVWFIPTGVCLGEATKAAPQLVIYSYDSFLSKKGLGTEIIPLFEKKCSCSVRAVAAGNGGQLLTRLQIDAERGHPTANVVVGIDEPIWERAKPLLQGWDGWLPDRYRSIIENVKVEPGFLPFDYGIFAFMGDQEALAAAKLKQPESLADFLKKAEWKRNLILEDPRTSTPGLAFLLYTRSVFGDKVWDAWKTLRSRWLTLAPGWEAAYGLFLKKEAPLVWSYTTSQAYHEEHGDFSGDQRRYRALIFDEGQPMQVEGAALVKGSFKTPKDVKLGKQFLEFLISPKVQLRIPKKNWMMPVFSDLELPASFRHLPQPKKLVRLPAKASETDQVLARWSRVIQE